MLAADHVKVNYMQKLHMDPILLTFVMKYAD